MVAVQATVLGTLWAYAGKPVLVSWRAILPAAFESNIFRVYYRFFPAHWRDAGRKRCCR
ncbi:hypothetical protein SCLCIDRAFT_1208432 [Scleroderma citrinum Foug A]|uniref:Uncharacterized protein n=1 Tax=Scleroderma citrinum Foug A TaxID=1036808 RepID=A0A0C3EM75_9AGAM|nr:hypothetical protein SCLCIDRAFT_1208432 [Scleroderma citrinum Foug A]